PFFALSTVMAPFVGQNTGAARHDRIRDAIRFCGKFCFGGSLLIWLLAATNSRFIAGMFSADLDTLHWIRLHLWIVPAGYGFFAWKLQFTSSFNAQRHPLYSSATFLGRFFVFMIPLAWAGKTYWGLPGLFVGIVLGNVGALGLAIALWRQLQRRR
ncbi:MAG: MATE family efflux transporter, partial [Kiritimatiellia bacterium]